jgi:hypothetical protein
LICVDVVAQEEATLTHRYNFENDTADDTVDVDAVNGILMAAPLFTDDAPAGTRSILLDGDLQFIDYPDPLDFGKQLSIVAWVKPDPAGVNIQAIMANAPGGWASDGFKLFFNTWTADDSVSDARVILEEGNGVDGTATATDVDALVRDEWSQVVVTVDVNGTNESMTYVNGVKLVDAGPVIVDMAMNSPWQIGAMGGGWTWMGGIDDVQIYDGILTDEDAEWLFNNPGSAIGDDVEPPVLLGDVNLDEVVNGLDVDPFVDVLLNGPFQLEADINEDGEVNGLDVDPFVAAVVGGGVAAVPEPSTLVLALGLALLGAGMFRRGRE